MAATSTEVRARIRSSLPVPRFAFVITVDGVPQHIALMDDETDAADAATDPSVRSMWRPYAKEGHDIRATLHVVTEQPDSSADPLPTSMWSVGPSIHTWVLKGDPAKKTDAPKKTDVTKNSARKRSASKAR